MAVIGLILALAAGAFGVDLFAKNRFHIRTIQVFGESLGVTGSGALFVIGAITGAALVLGLALLLLGLGRKGSKASSRRQERKEADNRAAELEKLREENAGLRAHADERSATSTEVRPVPREQTSRERQTLVVEPVEASDGVRSAGASADAGDRGTAD